MKIAFIGDIVGRPGRKIIESKLHNLIKEYNIDCVIANGENGSHGFGLTVKNCEELISYGIDIITGGNHTWDKKKDILTLLKTHNVIRPANYPEGVQGDGYKILNICDTKLAVINLMGMFSMPQVLNPFTYILQLIDDLHNQNIKHIFIDFHAESTAEKRVLMKLLQGKVSAICGTHTHIGTDDLEISNGTFYVSDVGLTGCRDNIIGMDSKIPIKKALTGLGGHFDIPKSCKTIMQLVIIDIEEDGSCIDAMKIKLYNDKPNVITSAIIN